MQVGTKCEDVVAITPPLGLLFIHSVAVSRFGYPRR